MAGKKGLPELPGFEILEPLGAGGRAEIYLARHKGREDELVAIKFLREEDLDRADRVQAFMDEVELSRLLIHPTIVRVYDGEFALGLPYLVMEHVDGLTLWELGARARRAKIQIPVGLAAYLAVMIADALDYAHNLHGPDGEALNLVHRDVSTVNVMVTFDGAVKLLDFGIARSKISSVHTQPGIIKGKLDYLSPEQCSGGPIDALTDVYALGVVLFELVSGKRPVEEEDVAKLFDKICAGKRSKVRDLRPDVPAELEKIIDRALAPKRRRRYGSAKEILKDLRDFIDHLPERPDSSTAAGFIRQLAPEELEKVQRRYGATNTTIFRIHDVPPEDATVKDIPLPEMLPTPETQRENRRHRSETVPQGEVSPAKKTDVASPDTLETSPQPQPANRIEPREAPLTPGAGSRRTLFLIVGLFLLALASGIVVARWVRDSGSSTSSSDSVIAVNMPDAAATVENDQNQSQAPRLRPELDFSPEAGAAPLHNPVLEDTGQPDAALVFDGSASMDFASTDAGSSPNATGGDGDALDGTKAYLTVRSRRRSALFIRGYRIGLTPVEMFEIEPGRYRLMVRNRYGLRRRWVELHAGDVREIEFGL